MEGTPGGDAAKISYGETVREVEEGTVGTGGAPGSLCHPRPREELPKDLPGWFYIRLFLALVVYVAWLAEMILLPGGSPLSPAFDPKEWQVFVPVTALFTGGIVPAIFLKSSITGRVVDTGQAGLDLSRRTIPALVITAIAGTVGLAIVSLAGFPVPSGIFGWLLVFLPVAAGEGMICWALVATHVETALSGAGIRVAAVGGFAAAAVLSTLPYSVPALSSGIFFLPLFLAAGLLTGFIFLVFRDILATILARTIMLAEIAALAGVNGFTALPFPFVWLYAGGAVVIVLAAGYLISRTS
jgi:hypothetical protein